MSGSFKTLSVFCLFIFVFGRIDAQQTAVIPKWSPAALGAGKISLGAEWSLRPRHSLNFQVGLPVTVKHKVSIDGKSDNAAFKGISALAGYRVYLGKSPFSGLYIEPFVKYLKEEMSGRFEGTLLARKALFDTYFRYEGIGVGAQLGAQFLIGHRFVLDFYFLGPEANSSSIDGRSTDVANSLPWTTIETQEAERTVKDAINDIPFLKDKAEVHADQQTKTITGNYNGFLPGFRIGLALGFRL